MKETVYQIYRISEFRDWLNEQTEKSRVQIDDRLSKIQYSGYFGEFKSVCESNEIWELKWKNGRRVYFAYVSKKNILVLLGGNKNGQEKDIRKAKSLFKKYTI